MRTRTPQQVPGTIVALLIAASLTVPVVSLTGCTPESANPDGTTQTAVLKTPEHLGPPPGSYTIGGDALPVVIPFEFYGMNLMVDAEMGGAQLKMLIDNGVMWDELWFYTSDLTDSLGVEYEEDARVEGAGEGEGMDSYTAHGVSIRFGTISFSDQPAIITPEEQGISELFPGVAGQLCGAFFKHFVVEFDFDEENVVLHEPASYEYDGGGAIVVMTRDPSGSYSIPVTLGVEGGRAIDTNLFIDLGGIHAARLIIDEEAGIPTPESERVLLGYGASGPIHGYKGRLESLTVGGYTLTDVPAVFADAPGGGDHTNVTIGLPAFRRFTVVFDYFRERLYLEPNSRFDEPYEG